MTADRGKAASRSKPLSTANRLLVGAAELFRRKGYAATTTRELSALLGIQNASLYYHMDKKEDLLYRVCVTTLASVSNEFQSCVDQTEVPIERLKLMIHRYVTTALQNIDAHATMLVEIRALSSARRKRIIKLRDRNVAIVRDTMADAQRSGQLRSDIAPKYLTLAMFNLVNWSIFWYRADGELSPDAIADLLATIFLEGASVRARPRSSP